MDSVYNEYSNKLRNYGKLIEEQNKSVKTLQYLRLLIFVVGFSVTVYTFIIKNYIISGGVCIVSLIAFIYLVNEYNKETMKRKHSIALKEINEKSIKRLSSEWREFQDVGSEFKDDKHNYSGDLDIFGNGSLFQYINTAKTFMGRKALKNRLIDPLKSSLDIKETQNAIIELATDLDWRQQFEAEGMIITDKSVDPEELYKWSEEREELYTKNWFIIFIRVLPVVTILLNLLAFSTQLISYKVPCIAVLIQLIILAIGVKKRSTAFDSIYKYKNNINIYYEMIKLLSRKNFINEYLKNLKNNLGKPEGEYAVTAFEKLFRICDKISERNNIYFIIVNVFLLWDYQCMIELEKWRSKSGKNLKKWLNVIGQFEALNSISIIAHDNPDWVMPDILDEKFKIKAEWMGHPLLGKERVCNNISMEKPRNILLITGSNMSGKSTFLRTIGINLVLSYIGSSVCAKKFQCSLMEIYTCMRISDNLGNSISSFYAEILRIKMIVESVKENKNVFFLLDELFKGTNSIDRHAGAIALLKQLGKQGASGLVSTHDLELCDLEQQYPKIKNYYFQEHYINNELKFDYKIREGVSNTRNALYLIKLAGIDIDKID